MAKMDDSKLQAQLKRLGKLDTRQAKIEMAEVLLPEAQQLAPVDIGFLRDSGKIDTVSADVSVVFTAPYAIFQEFGTSTQTGQPFLRPAIDNTERKMVQMAAKEMEREIKEKL